MDENKLIKLLEEHNTLDIAYHYYHPYLRELFPPRRTQHEFNMLYIEEERILMEQSPKFRYIVLQRDLLWYQIEQAFKENDWGMA